MSEYHVDIGAHVKSSDGQDLGKVDHLIVRGDTNRAGGFLLSQGFRDAPKIVPARLVASSTAELVVLKVTAAEVEELENYIHEQMLRAPGQLTYGVGFGGLVDIGGTGDTWMLRGSSGGQYAHTGTQPFFFEAPMGNVEVENVSSLRDDVVLIDDGTDIIDSEGKKFAHFQELIVGDKGQITGMLARVGRLFKHEIYIPISLVAGTSSDHVRLNVTAEEAESQSQAQRPE